MGSPEKHIEKYTYNLRPRTDVLRCLKDLLIGIVSRVFNTRINDWCSSSTAAASLDEVIIVCDKL